MIKQENFVTVKNKYEAGAYSLRAMIELVESGKLTKEEFHFITDYSYDGLKKSRGW